MRVVISEDLWEIEETPDGKIKVYERQVIRTKYNGQWYNSYRWKALHPNHIHATCRSAIAKAGFGNHAIWNWQKEKAKGLQAKGYSLKRIALAMIISVGKVKKLLY